MRARDQLFGWPRADLEAAGLLHGDITLSKVDKEDFEDELRLTLSMLPIADLPLFNSAETPGTWTRDWLRAVGAAMLAAKAVGPLRVLLAYADLFFPNDGPLQLTRGTLDELQSEANAPPIALTYSEGFARTRRDRDALRDEAIESLTRAVKLMPESAEAAVRLAHVRLEMHQPARAVPLLDRVVASGHGDWWYVAALMRGDAYAIGGDPPAAERLYRTVIDRFPRAQAPYVALAALQYSNGRHEGAAATIERMYARYADRATNGSEITQTDASAKAQASERVGESEGESASARVSGANEPRERSEAAQRRASERAGESEGRSPSVGVDEDDPWWTYSSNMGPAANAALDHLRLAVRQ
jgi:predicted Zn-dependent protease